MKSKKPVRLELSEEAESNRRVGREEMGGSHGLMSHVGLWLTLWEESFGQRVG